MKTIIERLTGGMRLAAYAIATLCLFAASSAWAANPSTGVITLNIANSGGSGDDQGKITADTATLAGDIVAAAWQNTAGGSSAPVRDGTMTGVAAWDGTAATTLNDVVFTWHVGETTGNNTVGNYCRNTSASPAFQTCWLARGDGSTHNGEPATITVTDIPYAYYDVIVYLSGGATLTAGSAFQPVLVNDTSYIGDSSDSSTYKTLTGETAWGTRQDTLEYGANAIRVCCLSSSTLNVSMTYPGSYPALEQFNQSGDNAKAKSQSISAVQIVQLPVLTCDGTAIALSTASWTGGTPASGGDVVLNLTADTTLTVDTAATYGTVHVVGSGSLTLDGSAAITATTLDIASTASVNMNASRLSPTTVTGSGTAIYEGGSTVSALPASNLFGTGWTGTVSLRNGTWNAFVPTNLGNADSYLRFTSVTGYPAQEVYNTNVPRYELVNGADGCALNMDNGFSFKGNDEVYAYVKTPELKGSGTLKANTAGTQLLLIVDSWSNFTGTLNLDGKSVWFGVDAPAQSQAGLGEVVGGTVRVGDDFTPPSSWLGWTVAQGFYGTGTVKVSSSVFSSASVTTNFFKNATYWKGNVEIAAFSAAAHMTIPFNALGNANSTVTLKGATDNNGGTKGFQTYLAPAELGSTINPTVHIDGTVTFNGAESTSDMLTTFTRVTGSSDAKLYFIRRDWAITTLTNYLGTVSARYHQSSPGSLKIGTVALDSGASTAAETKLVSFETSAPTGISYDNKGWTNIVGYAETAVTVGGVAQTGVSLEKRDDGLYIKRYVVVRNSSDEVVASYDSLTEAIAGIATYGANYSYYEVYDAGESVTLAAYPWNGTLEFKLKNSSGGAVTVTSASGEFAATAGDPVNGIIPYSFTDNPTSYTWTGSATTYDELYNTIDDPAWTAPRNWSYGESATATRYPRSGDTVTFPSGTWTVSFADNVACASMAVDGTVTINGTENKDIQLFGSITGTGTINLHNGGLKNMLSEPINVAPAVNFTGSTALAAGGETLSAVNLNGAVTIDGTFKPWNTTHTINGNATITSLGTGNGDGAFVFAGAVTLQTAMTVDGSCIGLGADATVVLATAGASLTDSRGTPIADNKVSTTVADSYVKLAGSTYSVQGYVTVTIPAGVENATATVNGDAVAVGGSVQVDTGTDVTIAWTAAAGYKITLGATQTINAIDANTTATAPTVAEMGAAVSDVNFTYGADYATATVTAIVSGDATTATLRYGNTDYAATSFVGNGNGTSTARFTNVAVTRDSSNIYAPASYEITTDAHITTGGTGAAVAADTTAWFSQSSENSGAPVNGSWTPTVVNLSTPTNVTDNTFAAATPSTSSRVVLEFEVCFSSTSEEDVSGEAQAAIKLAEDNGATTFMVLTNGNEWAAVSNPAVTPDPAATNKVVLTIDYGSNTYRVDVEGNSMTNSAGAADFPLAASRASVQNIDFAGSGVLKSMKGDQVEGYMVVDKNGTRYATIAEAIAAYTADPSIGPLTMLHSGTPLPGWSIVTQDGVRILKKLAKGFFFMAY